MSAVIFSNNIQLGSRSTKTIPKTRHPYGEDDGRGRHEESCIGQPETDGQIESGSV